MLYLRLIHILFKSPLHDVYRLVLGIKILCQNNPNVGGVSALRPNDPFCSIGLWTPWRRSCAPLPEVVSKKG